MRHVLLSRRRDIGIMCWVPSQTNVVKLTVRVGTCLTTRPHTLTPRPPETSPDRFMGDLFFTDIDPLKPWEQFFRFLPFTLRLTVFFLYSGT